MKTKVLFSFAFFLFCINTLFAEWSYIDDSNVRRVEESKYSNGTLYCRSYYDGYSSKQKNDYYICKLEGDKFKPLCDEASGFPTALSKWWSSSPNQFVVLNNGNIFAMFDNSILLYKNSKWSVFFQDTIENDVFLDINTINKDIYDNVWVVQSKKVIQQSGDKPIYKCIGGRLIKIADENISIIIDTNYNDSEILSDFDFGSCRTLESDSKGNIIGAVSNHFMIYNQLTGQFNTYDIETLYNGTNIQPKNIYIDAADRMWFVFKNNGYLSGGLISVYDKGNWTYIDSSYGLTDSLACAGLGYSTDVFLAKDNSIWITSNQGMLNLENKIAEYYLPEFILPASYTSAKYNTNITSITEGSEGELYFGAYPALLIYKENTSVSEDVVSNTENSFAYRQDNEVVINNKDNLTDNAIFKLFNSTGNEITVNYVKSDGKISIAPNSLPGGMYFYSIISNNHLIKNKFLIY